HLFELVRGHAGLPRRAIERLAELFADGNVFGFRFEPAQLRDRRHARYARQGRQAGIADLRRSRSNTGDLLEADFRGIAQGSNHFVARRQARAPDQAAQQVAVRLVNHRRIELKFVVANQSLRRRAWLADLRQDCANHRGKTVWANFADALLRLLKPFTRGFGSRGRCTMNQQSFPAFSLVGGELVEGFLQGEGPGLAGETAGDQGFGSGILQEGGDPSLDLALIRVIGPAFQSFGQFGQLQAQRFRQSVVRDEITYCPNNARQRQEAGESGVQARNKLEQMNELFGLEGQPAPQNTVSQPFQIEEPLIEVTSLLRAPDLLSNCLQDDLDLLLRG